MRNGNSAVYHFPQARHGTSPFDWRTFGVRARSRAVFESALGYKRCDDASQFPSASRDGEQAARNFLSLCSVADRFKRAVFRWPVSH